MLLPLLMISCLCFAQDVKEIIGKPIKIGNLLVAQFDFPKQMNWDDAKKASTEIGEGWRLPTEDELMILLKNKDKIGGFANAAYWSSTEEGDVYGAYSISFPYGTRVRFSKKFKIKRNVRAIKAI